jgi:hypothetical protein
MDIKSSISGFRNIADVGFARALKEGGTFRTNNGTIKIEKSNGKIKITESVYGQILLQNMEVKQSNASNFGVHKKAMKHLNKHPDQIATVVKEYKKEEDALAWFQRNMSSSSADAASCLKEIEKIKNFSKCTESQQAYIKEYAKQMIEGGDKKEFAMAVSEAMVLLYTSGIDELMFDEINFRDIAKTGAQMRADVIEKLTQVMKDNGGNYVTIGKYLLEQQIDGNCDASQQMRAFMMTQRQDPFEGRFSVSPKMPDDISYAKTVAIYKAFTAIALNKANFAGKNSENHTCKVYRGLARKDLEETYTDYDGKVKEDGIFTMRHSTLESTSIGNPIQLFNGKGSDTHTMEVPFSRIFATYFMSPEMCGNLASVGEHEFLCDLAGIPAKIKQNETDEDIAGYEQL